MESIFFAAAVAHKALQPAQAVQRRSMENRLISDVNHVGWAIKKFLLC
jgi:hypothetical protein